MASPEHIILCDADLAAADFSRAVGTSDPDKASYRYGVWLPSKEKPGEVAITQWGNAMQTGSLLPELISQVAALEKTPAGELMHHLGFTATYVSSENMSSGRATLPYLVDSIPLLNLPFGVNLPTVEGSSAAKYSAREGVEAASHDTILIATKPTETGINLVDDRLNHFLARILMPWAARRRLAEVAEHAIANSNHSASAPEKTQIDTLMEAIDTKISMGTIGFAVIKRDNRSLSQIYKELLRVSDSEAGTFADATFRNLAF